MSLLLKSKTVLLLLLFLNSFLLGATITGAYQTYLMKDYEKSFSIYLEVYRSDKSNKNALYGIVNSLAAQQKYQKALNWSDTLLTKEFDMTMAEKKGWLLGLLNQKKRARQLWYNSNVQSSSEISQKSSLLQSTGWGFYGAGNIKEAEWWFTQAQKLTPTTQIGQALLTIKEAKKALKPKWNANILGGVINYSTDKIKERGSSYGYSGGTFFGGEGSITLNNKHTITVMGSRFDAQFQEESNHIKDSVTASGEVIYGVDKKTLYYSSNGIDGYSLKDSMDYYRKKGYKLNAKVNFDTTYSTDYDFTGPNADTAYYVLNQFGLQDSLFYSLDFKHGAGKYSIPDTLNSLIDQGYTITKFSFDTVYTISTSFEGANADTSYYLVKVDTLGELSEIDTNNLSYDTLEAYPWDTTIHTDTTIKYTPDPIWQNSFYLSYKNPTFGLGANFSASNMEGMKTNLLGWAMVTQKTSWCNIVYNGYYTATEKLQFFQISPALVKGFKSFLFEIEPAYVWKYNGAKEFDIPGVQLSTKAKVLYYNSLFSLSEEIALGKRSFVAESEGKNQVTVMLPHQFSSSSVLSITPFTKKNIAIFSIVRYEQYKQMNRMVLLGGVDISW